jgi:hypothetical protein
MSIRKRNDSVKDGVGYDGSKGQNYAPKNGVHKQFDTDADHAERDYDRRSSGRGGDQHIERESVSQFGPGQGRHDHDNICSCGDVGQEFGTRDIWSDVTSNQLIPTGDEDGLLAGGGAGGGRPGPIKYGVNTSQTKGSKKISRS